MPNKALIVGVNDYAPAGPGGPDLNGCVNDARDVANTLAVLGFVPSIPGNMRILTNLRATRNNILDGLKWLITGAKRGELRVFYYSGHGSNVPDIDGDEINGKDETICPHDFMTAGMITDDQIAGIVKTLPAGVNLEILFDSCHSGTATRDLALATGAPTAAVNRFIAPPLDDSFFLEADPTLPLRSPLKARGRELAPADRLNHVLWAACREGQLAQEQPVNGAVRGVFTYNFCRILRRANGRIARKVLDGQLTQEVTQMASNQTPQLEAQRAAMANPVFGAARAAEA